MHTHFLSKNILVSEAGQNKSSSASLDANSDSYKKIF